MKTIIHFGKPNLTEEEILARAEVRAQKRARWLSKWRLDLIFLVIYIGAAALGVGPWHPWLHAHLSLLLGAVVGSSAQVIVAFVIERRRRRRLVSK
jgi:fatty acid desaturase